MDFRGHHALGTWPEPHQNELAGAKFCHSEATQRFHMHKDVRRPLAAGQEPETSKPVEPFNLRPLQAAGWSHADVRPRRKHLRRVNRGGLVHREYSERLIAFGALHALADQPCSFIGRLIAVPPQHGDVQKYIWPAIIRNDEAVAL